MILEIVRGWKLVSTSNKFIFLMEDNREIAGSKRRWKYIPRPRLGRSISDTRFCLFSKVRSAGLSPGSAPVYLNVYDLTPMNGYVYWAGFGIFHSGIEGAMSYLVNLSNSFIMYTVHGVEYAFGAHDYSSSGVFEVEPRQCPGFKFRKSIYVGTTCLDPLQVRELMEQMAVNYNGDTYHLIVKNCNHFCKDVCYKLTGNKIPKWVNRLAHLGSLCHCLLPEALQVSAVRHEPSFPHQPCEGETTRLRNAFTCLSSISLRQKPASGSSLLLRSSLRRCFQPWKLSRSSTTSLKKK